MWLDVYEDVNVLSKEEQLELFKALKNDLFPDEPDKITKLLKTIRETRFNSGNGLCSLWKYISET